MRYDFSKTGEEFSEIGVDDLKKCNSYMFKIFTDNGITDNGIIQDAVICMALIHYLFNLDLERIIKYSKTEYGLGFFKEYTEIENDMNRELVILDTEHTISERFRRSNKQYK